MRHFKDLPQSTGHSMTYAGIGNRDLDGVRESNTHEPVQNVMAWIAGELEKLGYTLNSGGAKGADLSFECGVRSPSMKNVFRTSDATDETRAIARELHPKHRELMGVALDLFARNTNQVFGRNLDITVDFVVCYTRDGCETARERNRDTGGTGQAIEMADRKGAPVFNMKKKDWLERLNAFLKSHGVTDREIEFPKGRLPSVPARFLWHR